MTLTLEPRPTGGTVDDHPALDRLRRFEAPRRAGTGRRPGDPAPMGYQPGLDGLRAVSVMAVIAYHAGFSWMHGGFFGVEVFFVVSGFLITSLLLEERERSRIGSISLAGFWQRRAKRLLPALAVVLLAVSTWAAVFGSAEQVSQLKRDLPWSIFYVANWGQILGDVPYFAAGDPPLLRHLWSLAVEEQWYVVWPLVFVALARTRLGPVRTAQLLFGAALAVMTFTAWLAASDSPLLGGPPAALDGVDRTNFMYLSTITRSSGLLLGAAAAYVWRPWRVPRVAARVPSRPLDVAAGVAVGALLCAFGVASLTERYVYQWLLPLVSVLSLVAVMMVVHPAATGTRRVFSLAPLVEIGKRSYGLYLWHWPIFVIVGATDGSVVRFVGAMALTVVASELCYRFVETPIRHGALGRWWHDARVDPRRLVPVGAVALLVVGLGVRYAGAEEFDPAAGGEAATFDLAAPSPTVAPAAAAPVTAPPATAAPAPTLPRTVAIVGDSQANSLAINLPDGIEGTFSIVNGAVEGCGVLDEGRVVSERDGFSNSFAICEGWQQEWAAAADGADVALVVIGAWDVFDVEIDGVVYPFASPEGDELFTRNLQSGIDAMVAEGAHVALLEVPCMRPQDVEGAGVPALPERGDDARVAHLNGLLREVAAGNAGTVTFVEGPDAWCADEAISSDLAYRWDGVHVYVPGAELIYETIAPALLALPA